jgi:DNA-binding protein HU-beta
MNKSGLTDHIANATGFTKDNASRAIDAFIEGVTQSLASGEDVRLIGFGTFVVKAKAATKGRNPRTGAEIDITARNVLSFRAGKELKSAVNSQSHKKPEQAKTAPKNPAKK